VETVGDAYIAGQGGWPLTTKNSAISVVLFGLDMVKATNEWAKSLGEEVGCRVGVATGECKGGIVGQKMKRYHLFGSLTTQVEVLESTSVEGRVQVSTSVKSAVESEINLDGWSSDIIKFEERKEPQLTTSKGDIHHYEEVDGPTFFVRSYSRHFVTAKK